MNACPDPARISAAASGEDLAVERHAADCATCHHTLSAERTLRSLAGRLPPYTLSTDRRRALEASIVAHAERTPPGSRRSRSRLGRTLVAAALVAAAALLGWRALPSSSRRPSPPPSPVAAPQPPPPPPPVVVPLSPEPAPTLTPSTGARFDHRPRSDRDLVVVTDGTLAIDATTTAHAVSLTDRAATPLSVRAEGARLEVRATRGAIHSVQVYAGSVEITHHGRTIVVTAGATWTAPPAAPSAPASTVRLPDTAAPDHVLADRAGADRDLAARAPRPDPTAFADGWRAYRAGDLAAAAADFARATSDPAVAEDATYWLAATHARAGNHALAIATYDGFLARFPSSPHTGAAHLALARLLAATDPDRAAGHRAAAAADPDPRVRAAATR